MRAVVITVSDKAYLGQRVDTSGPILADALHRLIGADVVAQAIVPDEPDQIRDMLLTYSDGEETADLIVTTGGTGPAPRDHTPEATLEVIEREMPGIPEMLRFEGYRRTPLAVISRGVAGIRRKTLIINLPGSPRAVAEDMEVLARILPHTIQMIRGENLEHKHQEHEQGRP